MLTVLFAPFANVVSGKLVNCAGQCLVFCSLLNGSYIFQGDGHVDGKKEEKRSKHGYSRAACSHERKKFNKSFEIKLEILIEYNVTDA